MLGRTGLRGLESGILEAGGEGLDIPDYPLSDPFKPEAIPTPQPTPKETGAAVNRPDSLYIPYPWDGFAAPNESAEQRPPGLGREELAFGDRGMPQSPFGWHWPNW